LDEQRAFYDEVERIGHKVGTFTSKEGLVSVAQLPYGQQDQFKNPKTKQTKMTAAEVLSQGNNSSSMIQKRKSNQVQPVLNAKGTVQQGTPQKRQKTDDGFD